MILSRRKAVKLHVCMSQTDKMHAGWSCDASLRKDGGCPDSSLQFWHFSWGSRSRHLCSRSPGSWPVSTYPGVCNTALVRMDDSGSAALPLSSSSQPPKHPVLHLCTPCRHLELSNAAHAAALGPACSVMLCRAFQAMEALPELQDYLSADVCTLVEACLHRCPQLLVPVSYSLCPPVAPGRDSVENGKPSLYWGSVLDSQQSRQSGPLDCSCAIKISGSHAAVIVCLQSFTGISRQHC